MGTSRERARSRTSLDPVTAAERATAAQPRTIDAWARGELTPAGSLERADEEVERLLDHACVGGAGDRLAEGEHRAAEAVVRAGTADPLAVDGPEVQESAARLVEGVLEELDVAAGALGDGSPAKRPRMKEVDLERAGHVVDAVAMLRIRPRAFRVLEDAELAAENLEVLPADRVERREGSVRCGVLRHGSGHPIGPTRRRAIPRGRPEERGVLGADGRPDHPPAVGMRAPADRRPQLIVTQHRRHASCESRRRAGLHEHAAPVG